MKQLKYIAFSALLLMPICAQAQYGQSRADRADRIAQNLSDEADRVWDSVRNRRFDRTDEQRDLYTALRNFAQNTRNFASDLSRSDAATYRSGAEQIIREAENISRLVNRTDTGYRLGDQWSRVEDQVDRLGRFYDIPFRPSRDLARSPYRNRGYNDDRDYRDNGGYGNDRGYDYGGYQSGVFRWRGRVDGTDYIYLRGDRVDIRHVQAQPIVGSSYDLPSPLPRGNVNVQLRRLRGRGRVELVQQPSASNNYTAGVLIRDDEGGADDYEFELTW